MLLYQSIRSAGEPRADLNTVVSSQKGHVALMIRSDFAGVRSLDLFDALKTRSSCSAFVPSGVQPQPHSEPRSARGFVQVVRYDAFHVLECRCGGGVRPSLVRNSAPEAMTAVCQSTKQIARSKRRVDMLHRSGYSAPPRPAATATASGSGVKSSPGLMKRFRSSPYCLS